MFFPFLKKSTTYVTLSMLPKTKRMKTMNSIAIGFPTLDVDKFVGWVELESWPLDHLFVVDHGSFWRRQINPILHSVDPSQLMSD